MKVVEKGIGILYPIENLNKERATPGPQKKRGCADGERIPQRTGIDNARLGTIVGRTERAAKVLEQEPIKLEFLEEALVA